jgi:hypothetical protein
MKRKLATKTNGAGHRASGLRRETDVVGPTASDSAGLPLGRLPAVVNRGPTIFRVATCTMWIAWWLNLRLD